MRIGIDVSRTVPKRERSGIGRYADLLVQGLAGLDTEHQFILYPGLGDFVHPEYGVTCDIAVPNRPNFRRYTGPLPAYGIEQDRSKREAVDVVHATAFACPNVEPASLAVTVYDLTYHLMPEFHLRSNIAFCEKQMGRAIELGKIFIAISEQTRKDFISRYDIRDEKVQVVHLAAESIFAPITDTDRCTRTKGRYGIAPKYVLFVGSVEPRKNIATLLKAFGVLSSEGRFLDHELVLIGTRGWMNEELYELPAALRIADRVKFLGYVDDEDLPALYSGAQLFVYPSLYEGFGLPVLEAMSCGAAVVTSKAASLPEVVGDAGILVDPRDVIELAQAMRAVLGDAELMGNMRARSIRRAQLFSVGRMARETLEVYEAIGPAKSPGRKGGWMSAVRRAFSRPVHDASAGHQPPRWKAKGSGLQ
jgi:glycosyltransferase involved in cell wall biosynthesis